ncbi:colanic acid biosynthesis acetyltransferase WcaF [Dysgonomonas sp. 216]|uniref:WcaF family extracellular polysaccharide biosynthesis acetyltransferase n=1 Tax=Dysgonomonas sp. 216 TaxID=2302934 RepID=UPI0013D0176D|nr:WcaF family extracellular polysaccharide biosynthesis acetyltransferase [Dysgonomonas sp. 216]NDW19751.1 colanic acid biosynthesis acetyltransferase WcaF [Dysgonomonas sp. 216]
MNSIIDMTQSQVKLQDFDPSVGLNRGSSKIKEICWYLVKVLFFLSALPYPNSLKAFLLRKFGAKVGTGVVIKPRVNIHMPWKLEIGNYVWIGEESFLLNFELLKIGNNVCISQRAFLCGGNHNYKKPEMPYRNGPITLEDGSWVGASCFVCPDITIGTDCVVSACSVVKNNLPANTICEGNPAKPVKSRW